MEFMWLIVIGTSIWVWVDAAQIGVKKEWSPGLFGLNPGGWFLTCLLFWIIGFPVYLVKRGDFKRIAAGELPPGDGVARNQVICPFCRSQIDQQAIVCRYCQRDLVQVKSNTPEAPVATIPATTRPCPFCRKTLALEKEGAQKCPSCQQHVFFYNGELLTSAQYQSKRKR
jgi:ssDNA-binding Zn-finger/Zn-ribbon topoisomerase 1